MPRCAAIIPCLNEAAHIVTVVARLREFVCTVLVVDDGSRDATSRLAQDAGAKVLRHDRTRGKGAALLTGWSHAARLGFERVLTMDGDGQHSPEDVPKILQCAELSGADLVVGNRMLNPGSMPPLRRWVNRWMSRRISALAEQPLPDSQCGFRLMNLRALAEMPVSAEHFEIESDVLLAFARAGRRIEFVPIQVIYSAEQSKIHPLRDAARWIRWWWRARKFVTASRPVSALALSALRRINESRRAEL